MLIQNIESPILAQWDITTGCNFSCSFCLTNSGKHQDGELSLKKAKVIVDRLYEGGILFLRILGGEPFYRNDIMKIMHYAVTKGMLLSFSTNASLIDEKIASLLKDIEHNINYFQVSLYGVEQDSYKETTKNKNSFQLVNNGIQNLKKQGLNPYIFWVLTADNIKYVELAYNLVKDWGFSTLRISPKLNLGRASVDVDSNLTSNASYWRAVIDALSKLKKLVNKNRSPQVQLHARPLLGEFLHRKTGLPYFYITCKAATTMVYVDYKGDASPCPFAAFMPKSYRTLFDSQKKISLLTYSLARVWESDAFANYRKLQKPDENPNLVFQDCNYLKSGMCNPCIYTPCTCRATIKMINNSLIHSVIEKYVE